jgi:thiol-disulfide isomerase/thioredoxin
MSLQLPLLDGSRFVQLSDFPGRAVVLNFWGSECPPCVREMPLLASLSRQYAAVQFLGVATDGRERAIRFVNRFKPAYPQLFAINRADVLMRRFGNLRGGLPYTVVLTPAHLLCVTHLGEVDAEWIAAAVSGCVDTPQESSSRTKE